MPNAVIAHSPDGAFDLDALRAEAARWPGIDGMDLVPAVGATQRYDWDETSWTFERATASGKRRAFTSSRSTMGSSATSCGSSTTAAAR